MSTELTAALIGAGVAAAGLLVQSVFGPLIGWIFRNRERKRDALERYAPAIGAAAEALYYRLSEVMASGRHAYLKTESKPTNYHTYKFNSTVYRLASLIGWIWAMKIEQSLLAEAAKKNSSLHESLQQFATALADGAGVEAWMVKELAGLWGLPQPDQATAAALGAHLDSLVDNLSPAHIVSRRDICTLQHAEKLHMLMDISAYFAQRLNAPCPEPTLLDQTTGRACDILSARQAWIYRDWQSAIGETMMERVEGGPRAFQAKGYAAFEELFREGNRWLNEIAAVFRDLDPQSATDGDFRVGQVAAIRKATAQIIVRLASIDNIRACVDADLVSSIRGEFKDLR